MIKVPIKKLRPYVLQKKIELIEAKTCVQNQLVSKNQVTQKSQKREKT